MANYIDADKLKAEIERRLKKYATDVTMPLEALGKVILELKGILSFLSTLESEKPMNQDELEKAVIDYFEGYWPGMETAEQCNTDLHFTPPAIMRLARHFAQWGAEHLADASKTSPEDLEEAAIKYFDNNCYLGEVGFECDSVEAFIGGANWQKEKLMKEAVEGTVYGNGDYTWVAGDIPSQFKYGDKVRVIVLPKECEK